MPKVSWLNGASVSYQAIRQWCQTFGPAYARTLEDAWATRSYLDELFVTIRGRRQYLWRAVDQNGDVIDILVQSRRDRRAATRFSEKLLKGQGHEPRRLLTNELRSYSAVHRTAMPSAIKSAAHAQRFLLVHGRVQNLFRVGHHLLQAAHHRLLRTRSFGVWREVTCV